MSAGTRACCQAEEQPAEHQHHHAPPEIDVDADDTDADEDAVPQENAAADREEHAEGQTEVERVVHRNTTFSKTSRTATAMPSGSGRLYHGKAPSSGCGVSPYTRPRSCSSGGAVVRRLMMMVTTKQVDHAQIAPQKFCAMSDG